uniref:ShKT domain-containing protein n=1 Tax=Parastrongyloides trichosuri TaxID=131310 RepID=A0A0N4Z009_PARTI
MYPYGSQGYTPNILLPSATAYSGILEGTGGLGYLNPSLNSLMYRNGISNSYLNSFTSGIPSSYLWNSRTGLGGLSGYEGALTANTLSNYIQPDASIPPMGVPDGTSLTRNLITSPYIPVTSGGSCKDQMSQCAVYASTGQCSSSPLLMTRLCPISCGTGCTTTDLSSGNFNNVNAISTMASIDSPFTTLSTGLNGGYPSFNIYTPFTHNSQLSNFPIIDHALTNYDSLASYQFDNIMKYLNTLYTRFQNLDNIPQNFDNLIPIDSNALPFTSIYDNTESQYLSCKDSHIDGCPSWSAMGFCSRFPTYMNIYCRGSCNSCGNKNLFSSDKFIINDKNYIDLFSGGVGSYVPLVNTVRSGIYPLTERKPSSLEGRTIPSIPTLKRSNIEEEMVPLSRREKTNKLRELLEMAME